MAVGRGRDDPEQDAIGIDGHRAFDVSLASIY
jgi:hypothetical protein